jgi:hypothetical protein
VIRLSKASYRKMIQNLAWATGYNAFAIPLAAGVLAWAGLTLRPQWGLPHEPFNDSGGGQCTAAAPDAPLLMSAR